MTALGLMSGTSLDGIDVAMLETDGEQTVRRGPSRTYSYDADRQTLLRQAIGDARSVVSRQQVTGRLAEAERQLTGWHIEAVQAFCQETGVTSENIDVIGFHGQTVIHCPEQQFTLQLGDGQALAKALRVPVVYDLRQADVQAGGQGAPLVPVYHRALAASIAERPVAFVNIGGVANITWIGPDGELVAFDTGPGNALLNDWCQARIGKPFDEDGRLAAAGRVDEATLAQLLGHPYFEDPPPKSLDRNSFAGLPLGHLSDTDGAATLLEFTRRSILLACDWLNPPPRKWIVCGGGRRNAALMAKLPGRGALFLTAEEAGFDGDAMEAEAWAYLAVRSLAGLPFTYPMTTGAPAPMSGGVVARP